MPSRQEDQAELWRLLRTIYREALKRLNARLAKEKITFSQYSVLLALSRNGPMQMNRLSEHMLVAPANTTGLVDRMEKRGYVKRTRDSNDRRLFVVSPTPLGSATLERISGRFLAYVQSISGGLSEPELSTTLKSLRQMLAKVQEREEI